jgi:hypothetical protein
MAVKQMAVVTYETRWKWSQSSVQTPTWTQVEEAVCALEPFHRPFIHLFLGEPDLVEDYMSIIGGPGRYWVGATIGDQDVLCVADPSQGDEEVAVWTSDQGFSTVARHVCSDVGIALAAAQYFFEHGAYHPDLQWEAEV